MCSSPRCVTCTTSACVRRLGLLFLKVMKDKDRAMRHCRTCLQLAHSLVPVPVGNAWFKVLRSRSCQSCRSRQALPAPASSCWLLAGSRKRCAKAPSVMRLHVLQEAQQALAAEQQHQRNRSDAKWQEDKKDILAVRAVGRALLGAHLEAGSCLSACSLCCRTADGRAVACPYSLELHSTALLRG